MTANEDWKRVAEAVRARRLALGYSQDDSVSRAGGLVSLVVWSKLENARQTSYRERSLAGVVRALEWPSDAIVRLLAGESAQNIASSIEPAAFSGTGLAAKLGHLSDDQRKAIEGIIDTMLSPEVHSMGEDG